MASKYNANLVDVQNDDVEIDLQFQDFEGSTTSNLDDHKSQTIYFNSFPDSAEDDQEQKLLGEEESESKEKSSHSFWSFEYYQQFFDVESKQVGDRIIWSMVPKPGVNYLQSYIRPNPDLYGPFWICITLVFTTAIAGNLSNYLQTPSGYKWKYDFHKVTLATSSIFSYAWLVPLLVWGVLLWRGSKANISLLEMICLYGYSLAIFVPVSLLWLIPLRWLQWCLGIVAAVLSGGVLVRTIQPAISHEARKVALAIAILILVLHAALALGFMLYFFYPPNSTESPITQVAPSTGQAPQLSNQPPESPPEKIELPPSDGAATEGNKKEKQREAKREERAKEDPIQKQKDGTETKEGGAKQETEKSLADGAKGDKTVANKKTLPQTEDNEKTPTQIIKGENSSKIGDITEIAVDQKQPNSPAAL